MASNKPSQPESLGSTSTRRLAELEAELSKTACRFGLRSSVPSTPTSDPGLAFPD
jgi:hypothetical protein